MWNCLGIVGIVVVGNWLVIGLNGALEAPAALCAAPLSSAPSFSQGHYVVLMAQGSNGHETFVVVVIILLRNIHRLSPEGRDESFVGNERHW